MYPYRAFISYSHDDRKFAEQLDARLRELGLHPTWDRDIRPGTRFPDVIRHGIGHAHVFIPVLTRRSAKRPWVHQETGYAMGLEIPVLPVAIQRLPGGMLGDLHAMRVRRDFADLDPDRLGAAVEDLLAVERDSADGTFRDAPDPERRAEMLTSQMREALQKGAHGPFRQEGALSSFGLPAQPETDAIWLLRDGQLPRNESIYRRLYDERMAIEAYAREHGCRLVIDPSIPFEKNGPEARRTRLRTLLDFLEDDSVADVEVVVRKRQEAGSLTIGGDWFSANTLTPRPGQGYFQTIFTWHAPTVLGHLRRFDRDFAQRLTAAGLTPETSRQAAIKTVEREIGAV